MKGHKMATEPAKKAAPTKAEDKDDQSNEPAEPYTDSIESRTEAAQDAAKAQEKEAKAQEKEANK